MTIEEKYNQLLNKVESLVRYQKKFMLYRASSDMESIKKLQRELDKIIEHEKSQQKSLF